MVISSSCAVDVISRATIIIAVLPLTVRALNDLIDALISASEVVISKSRFGLSSASMAISIKYALSSSLFSH